MKVASEGRNHFFDQCFLFPNSDLIIYHMKFLRDLFGHKQNIDQSQGRLTWEPYTREITVLIK